MADVGIVEVRTRHDGRVQDRPAEDGALEHGQRLGEDVFAPQPSGFYLLLRVVSALGADSVRGFHVGMVVVAIATCLAAYLLARALAGPMAGLLTSALLTVAPPFPLYAHRVLADIPPLGATLLAFWLEVTLLTGLLGFSIGKRICGVVVVGPDGGPIGIPRAAARTALVCLVFPAFVTNREKRGLQDVAAGSVVSPRVLPAT